MRGKSSGYAVWAAFALVAGCTVTTDSGTNTTCSPDPTVAGCTGGSIGYSCTGADAPEQSNPSLVCSSGQLGNAGSTLYCCEGATVGGNDAAASDTGVDGAADVAAPDAASDAGTADAGTDTDAGTDSAADTSTDAGTCPIGASTGSTSCDQCLESQCCAQIVACDTPDDAGVDDGGASACEQLVQCTLDCAAGNAEAGVDGGSVSGCEAICDPA
ncbi:MAG TPA: hypothetical protein VE987_17115, partial [Polyangiaceae bacterium]|nr:hypothetical protein [Polyangiaceae bacterium]